MSIDKKGLLEKLAAGTATEDPEVQEKPAAGETCPTCGQEVPSDEDEG